MGWLREWKAGFALLHCISSYPVDNRKANLCWIAELAQFGQQVANALGGKLVDDNIRPLSPAGIEKIQTQLVHIYQKMEAHEIPAGGRRALRLFN